jgi:hypothetical protein
MRITGLRITLLLCAFSITASGCALLLGAGAGAGAYAYLEGNLKATYDAALPQTWEATLQALQQVGMKPDVERHDAFGGVLRGAMADGREFAIALTRVSDSKTEVAIRIGLGDKKASQTIHKKIAAILKSSARRTASPPVRIAAAFGQ